MEGTHKEPKFASEDVISSMPDNVVTHILDGLPIQYAVRTGVLAKKWRYKWTMLSQLVFDERFFLYLTETNDESKLGKIITRLLLHLKGGAITKFVLYIEHQILDDEDIAHWILFLSNKGVKDLTILKMQGPPLKLPTHLFACLELKHLKLVHCCFDPPPSFCGFPNLLSFETGLVRSESSKIGEFITQCPLLEILNMGHPRLFLDISFKGYCRHLLETRNTNFVSVDKVKLVDIAKLANLKILSLSVCNLDNVMITSIFELLGFLPKLQELNLDFAKSKFTEGGARKKFSTAFPSLEALKLSSIDLSNGIMLSCAFEMIKHFPNLQTLEIKATRDCVEDPTSLEVDYNTMGTLQLRSVLFTSLKGSENELCLIKYLLASSPFLKNIAIHHHLMLSSEEKLMFSRKLLKLHRASPTAEIDLY